MIERILMNPITKEKVLVITIASETNGAYAIIEDELLPGGSNSLHFHRIISQTYTVTKGQLFIHLGGKKIIKLEKGEKYIIQPGEVHSEFNPTSQTVRFTVKITPGHQGYENMMRILHGLANDNKVNPQGLPNDFATLALLMQMGDTYFTSYFTSFKPWLDWNARKARKSGIEDKLYNSYCRPW